jgi:hypothetical protein
MCTACSSSDFSRSGVLCVLVIIGLALFLLLTHASVDFRSAALRLLVQEKPDSIFMSFIFAFQIVVQDFLICSCILVRVIERCSISYSISCFMRQRFSFSFDLRSSVTVLAFSSSCFSDFLLLGVGPPSSCHPSPRSIPARIVSP